MKVEAFEVSGPLKITLDMHSDSRGFFIERFNEARFESFGLPKHFVQDNHSRSLPGVIRGLHFQFAPAQGKLVGVVRGQILDIFVDIRKQSPTFGKTISVELSGDRAEFIWVPAGFAHGFSVLGNEPADVIYKVDASYGPKGEGGIRFDDPTLAIDWKVSKPIVSDRDRALPSFEQYCGAPRF